MSPVKKCYLHEVGDTYLAYHDEIDLLEICLLLREDSLCILKIYAEAVFLNFEIWR